MTQIDPNKNPADPFIIFSQQIERMKERNTEYYLLLKRNKILSTKSKIKLADARRTGIKSDSINAIITSPPYVTSYEYADIHQLTGYWFNYITDLSTFRTQFIGTFYSKKQFENLDSKIAQKAVKRLNKANKRIGSEVSNYFHDMGQVAKEMHRILSSNGVACLVIGNTTIRNVKIRTAEAFAEMLVNVGFEIENVIRRSIVNKQIPTIRDKVTGKFTKLGAKNSKRVYPDEFIIVARKPNT